MGGFNQTCAVSRTPIVDGDEAVMVVVARDLRYKSERFDIAGHTGGAHCWLPVSLPIRGRCGDFGRLETWDDGPAVAISEAAIGIALAELMDVDGRRDFTLGGKDGAPRLSAVFVHADLHERLTRATKDNIGHAVEAEAERAKHARFIGVAAAMSRNSPLARTMPEAVERLPLNSIGLVRDAWTSETGEQWREAPYVSRFFSTSWHNQHPYLTQSVIRALEREFLAGRDSTAILDEVLAYQFLDANMDRLAREWAPAPTQGHDVDTSIHRELADWTLARCGILDRDPDEDWEPDAPSGP